ncbi:MAG: WecB/TagA/CpsF family glycosyltransferase, partial [Cyanobacteria bacterium P01_G01_bin.38]
MSKVNILNVEIDNISQVELLENLRSGGIVFTPNIDHIVKLQDDREFYQAYTSADYKVCDSQILMYVSRLLRKPIREKISGSDFFPVFYNYFKDDEDVKIFLLGAAEGVAKKAQRLINQKVGREIIVQAHSPSFGFEKDEQESIEIIDLINHSGATVLAIGVGAPKQEKWLYKYSDQLRNIKVILAVGATIDFEAGHVKRAPKWMSQVGLEWLHRMLHEPKRLWKRYLIDDFVFFWLVAKRMVLPNLFSHKRHYIEQSTDGSTASNKHSAIPETDQLKVLLVGPSLTQRGGMATVQNLILGSAPKSVVVKHISTHDEGSVAYRLRVFAIAVIAFTWNLLRNNIDLVHIHVSEKGSVFRKILILLMAKVFRKPVVMHAHGCEFHLFHDNLSRWMRRFVNAALQQADYFVALSESWKQYYVS